MKQKYPNVCLVHTFETREKTEEYLRQIEKETDRQETAEWAYVEREKRRPGSGTWHTVEYARRYQKMVACCIGKSTKADDGNGILVRDNKAYALKDNAGMDYILKMSQNRYEQMPLPV